MYGACPQNYTETQVQFIASEGEPERPEASGRRLAQIERAGLLPRS